MEAPSYYGAGSKQGCAAAVGATQSAKGCPCVVCWHSAVYSRPAAVKPTGRRVRRGKFRGVRAHDG